MPFHSYSAYIQSPGKAFIAWRLHSEFPNWMSLNVLPDAIEDAQPGRFWPVLSHLETKLRQQVLRVVRYSVGWRYTQDARRVRCDRYAHQNDHHGINPIVLAAVNTSGPHRILGPYGILRTRQSNRSSCVCAINHRQCKRAFLLQNTFELQVNLAEQFFPAVPH